MPDTKPPILTYNKIKSLVQELAKGTSPAKLRHDLNDALPEKKKRQPASHKTTTLLKTPKPKKPRESTYVIMQTLKKPIDTTIPVPYEIVIADPVKLRLHMIELHKINPYRNFYSIKMTAEVKRL